MTSNMTGVGFECNTWLYAHLVCRACVCFGPTCNLVSRVLHEEETLATGLHETDYKHLQKICFLLLDPFPPIA